MRARPVPTLLIVLFGFFIVAFFDTKPAGAPA
jgi:hypothetical protein